MRWTSQRSERFLSEDWIITNEWGLRTSSVGGNVVFVGGGLEKRVSEEDRWDFTNHLKPSGSKTLYSSRKKGKRNESPLTLIDPTWGSDICDREPIKCKLRKYSVSQSRREQEGLRTMYHRGIKIFGDYFGNTFGNEEYKGKFAPCICWTLWLDCTQLDRKM